MNWQRDIEEFMHAAQQDVPTIPTMPTDEVREFRIRLIAEELKELSESDSLESWADALADLVYVTVGAAVASGIDLDGVFRVVHAANMRKFGPGSARRADGKWLKPPDWTPPDIQKELQRQRASATLPVAH